MKRKIFAIVLVFALLIQMGGAFDVANMKEASVASKYSGEVRGIWVSFCDFGPLGLKNKSKSVYRANVRKFIKKASENKINRIYFHVRAFDDATWKSNTFKASADLTSKATAKKTAAKTYSYDPLKIFIEEAHSKNIKIEAYMNPYRITYRKFLNPASKNSTDRINRAVNELKKYNLDGFHFDDYFYHSQSCYVTPSNSKKYNITVQGKTFKKNKKPSAKNRRLNVNKMLKSVKYNVHKKKGVVFGVSPAGNYENCMAAGADVKTWLGSSGHTYVDYVTPQIYWTDKWGRKGNVKMYTSRLKCFVKLRKNKKVKLYIGLASYRTGKKASDDIGWSKSNKNLASQLFKLRSKGANGFVLFEASDLYRKGAKKELAYLKNQIKHDYNTTLKKSSKAASSKSKKKKVAKISFVKKSLTVRKGKTKKLKIKFTGMSRGKKYIKYRSSNTRIATVSKSGKVKAKHRRGYVTVTAKIKGCKIAKCKIRVR